MSEEEKEAIENLEHIVEYWEPDDENDELANIEYNSIKVAVNLIDKLQKELEQERKLTNLIIDDFQAENYFINMTNKEVREYYSKREELK